jgi:hypothetical protein
LNKDDLYPLLPGEFNERFQPARIRLFTFQLNRDLFKAISSRKVSPRGMEHHELHPLFPRKDLLQLPVDVIDFFFESFEISFIDGLVFRICFLERSQDVFRLNIHLRRGKPDMGILGSVAVRMLSLFLRMRAFHGNFLNPFLRV